MTRNPIEPDSLYTPDEAAWELGFRSASSRGNRNRLYEIPKQQLPRVYTGANGGKCMVWGRDLIAYIEARRQVA